MLSIFRYGDSDFQFYTENGFCYLDIKIRAYTLIIVRIMKSCLTCRLNDEYVPELW